MYIPVLDWKGFRGKGGATYNFSWERSYNEQRNVIELFCSSSVCFIGRGLNDTPEGFLTKVAASRDKD